MKKIGFIGLGNMGYHMSINLTKNNYEVYGFDVSEKALENIKTCNVIPCKTIKELAENKDIIITMLPNGKIVNEVWREILHYIDENTIVIDCSTIEVSITKELQKLYQEKYILTLDAPVSGGTTGAEKGTLTFMVGGEENVFQKIIPIFNSMGKKSILCGKGGAGQSAKLCNNLLLAITMKGVGEALQLANNLNVNFNELFEVLSTSTGACWAVNTYFPVKGVGPESPADNDFKPGFTSNLMCKDLSLAIDAANVKNLNLSFGNKVFSEYKKAVSNGKGDLDFSCIVQE